jgi:predicted transcriptional regulator
MKSIIISIKPEQALNILNGKKTLELRKSVPKDFVGWVYGYVTKSGKLDLIDQRHICVGEVKKENTYALLVKPKVVRTLKGTIPFRFWFDEYEALEYHKKNEVLMWDNNYYYYTKEDNTYYNVECILDELCLEHQQVSDYGEGKDLYAWHINKLEVFDKPMVLSEFKTLDISKYQDVEGNPSLDDYYEVKRPPQSWQYVWVAK